MVKCDCLNLLPFSFPESPGFRNVLSVLGRSSARCIVIEILRALERPKTLRTFLNPGDSGNEKGNRLRQSHFTTVSLKEPDGSLFLVMYAQIPLFLFSPTSARSVFSLTVTYSLLI